MKSPLIRKRLRDSQDRKHERGVTMALVALAMVAIIAMAALSIDVVTLYLARQEAQRAADGAAIAAANVISVSGLTGDPTNSSGNWASICGPDNGTNGLATRVAKAVISQDAVGGIAANTVNVTYSAQSGGAIGAGTSDCTTLAASSFGVNPIVTVKLTRSSLPSFFSRIWGNTGNQVSGSATAEAFNPSNSSTVSVGATTIPLKARCVKPWVVPNQDPLHNTGGAVVFCAGGSGGNCAKIVDLTDGHVVTPGVSLNGSGAGGMIGETFWLNPDCRWGPSTCAIRINPPQANYNNGSGFMKGPPNLIFAPGQLDASVSAIPSCTTGDQFEQAIEGCDAPTNYTCGVPVASGGTNAVDLSSSPDIATADGVSCLTHQATGGDTTAPTGQDYLSTPIMGQPASYPFQIHAGTSNPMVSAGLASGSTISMSSSIVSLPIYDETSPAALTPGSTTNVTFVGFLQVFINAVDPYGNVNVTVLNVAGCSNNATGAPLSGNSPVPVRLITPP
jgi:Flp pilus assembly protein TadG